jgi:hypothetical protein
MIQVLQLIKNFYAVAILKNLIFDSKYWNEVIKILFSVSLENQIWKIEAGLIWL